MQQQLYDFAGKRHLPRTVWHSVLAKQPIMIERSVIRSQRMRLIKASALGILLSVFFLAAMVPLPLSSAAAHNSTADVLRPPYTRQVVPVSAVDVLRGPYEFSSPALQITTADILREPYN